MIAKQTTVLGLRGYTDEDKCEWADETVEGGPEVRRNPRIGTIAIGVNAAGYDQPRIYELNGGGVTILPYAWIDGVLHVVLLRANRDNLGKAQDFDDLEAIGGRFDEDGEPAVKAAIRELLEEAGLYIELTELEGMPFVSNRELSFVQNEDEGIYVFSSEVEGEVAQSIRNNPDLVTLPIHVAIMATRDGITRASLATLIAHVAKVVKG
jgi:8-oxo-dGTP pyrophosphatase MutT (NUDIX family)